MKKLFHFYYCAKGKTGITFFILLVILIYSSNQNTSAQAGEWVWIKGDSTNTPSYGLQGVPSPLNNPSGLYESCEWTDLNGNFWVYGGSSLAALWKYDPVSNEWTWMKGPTIQNYTGNYGTKGVSSPSNEPPYSMFGPMSWLDNQGNFWLFGADGIRNNLWKYNVSTNEWTWMKGPGAVNQPGIYGTMGIPDTANNPPSRCENAAAWTDNSGDLWLFGGQDGSHTGDLNDVWRYNIASNSWTWMKGSDTINPSGVYGQLGIANISNTPAGRFTYARWKDNTGNFWIFGGARNPWLQQNDLWKYDPLSNEWTWMSGDSSFSSAGYYGNKCTLSAQNIPSCRFENRAVWKDPSGNFWMYGGWSNSSDWKNDLWVYCVATNQWTWVSGDSTYMPYGNWGTIGVSSPFNQPPVKFGAIGWTDGNNHLYLFGGSSDNSIWKFTIDTNCTNCQYILAANFISDNNLCAGSCTNFYNLSTNSISYQWNFPGGNPDTSTAINPDSICYVNPGSYDVQLIASNANGSDTLFLTNYINVYPTPPPQGITQNGDTLFAIAGASFYQWYFNGNIINGANDYFYVASTSGDYNVIAIDIHGCEVEAVINDVLAHAPLAVGFLPLAIYPNPVEDKCTIQNAQFTMRTAIEISVFNLLGEKTELSFYKTTDRGLLTMDCRLLSPGIYSIEILSGENIYRAKFVKQ